MGIIKLKLEMLRSCDVSQELFAVIRFGALFSAIAFLFSLCWGFDLSMLLGLFIGWVYLCICYIYLADTVCSVAKITNIKAARKKIMACYFLRFAGLFLLCWLSFEIEIINVVGVLIPQFFPKIIMYIKYVKKGNNHGRS